ncbi:MAG TPA: NUDIX domain-containing protein [Acetobacteraceae bacterium]|nr:NUDIX domain-containing protein [Acetobacteraceae bacterium]
MPARQLPTHPDVRIEADQRVWDGRFPLDVIRFRHRRFDGTLSGVKTWEVWCRGRAAALLPYDPVADAVVLIEQFRLPALAAGLDPVLVELPAGLCDGSETPEQTIRREAQEETGIRPDRLQHIGDFLLTPGGSDELCALFAGRVRVPATASDGIVGHCGSAAEQEDIRVRVWPAASAIDAALAGRIPNSVAAIALLWLNARRPALRAHWTE